VLAILTKEFLVGLVNGLAIGIVTALGVLLWSQSLGLCCVMGVAMVLSMALASLSGAAVPILTKR